MDAATIKNLPHYRNFLDEISKFDALLAAIPDLDAATLGQQMPDSIINLSKAVHEFSIHIISKNLADVNGFNLIGASYQKVKKAIELVVLTKDQLSACSIAEKILSGASASSLVACCKVDLDTIIAIHNTTIDIKTLPSYQATVGACNELAAFTKLLSDISVKDRNLKYDGDSKTSKLAYAWQVFQGELNKKLIPCSGIDYNVLSDLTAKTFIDLSVKLSEFKGPSSEKAREILNECERSLYMFSALTPAFTKADDLLRTAQTTYFAELQRKEDEDNLRLKGLKGTKVFLFEKLNVQELDVARVCFILTLPYQVEETLLELSDNPFKFDTKTKPQILAAAKSKISQFESQKLAKCNGHGCGTTEPTPEQIRQANSLISEMYEVIRVINAGFKGCGNSSLIPTNAKTKSWW